MNDTFFLIIYIIFAIIVFVFFFFAVKGLFYSENTLTLLGLKDETLLKKLKNTKRNKVSRKVNLVIDSFISALIIGMSLFLVTINSVSNPTKYFDVVPVAIVSGSMSKKDSSNTYLKENDLNDQFPTGSTILLHKMPEKNDLKQYDVVAYKNKKGVTVVHRIVSYGYYDSKGTFIQTSNIEMADKFVFRGDYNNGNDSEYVDYSSMIGIYKGEYVPYLGYFVQFAQSYFGLACFVAMVAIIISYDCFESKNRRIEIERYIAITGDYSVIKEKYYDKHNEENFANMETFRRLIEKNKAARLENNLKEIPELVKAKSSSAEESRYLDRLEIMVLPEDLHIEEKNGLNIIRRSFMEKINKAPKEVQDKYEELKAYILSYEGVKSRISIPGDSYRYKKELLIKITIEGKTLKVYFALDPRNFVDTSMPIYDASNKACYSEVPALLKVRSDLSLKRAKSLVDQVLLGKGLTKRTVIENKDIDEKKRLKIVRRSFVEKMNKASKETKEKYDELKSYILAYDGIRSRISVAGDSYRFKKELLIKITIAGKTLKVYFALDPHSFDDTALPIYDASDKTCYSEVPALLKVRSDLSLKRAKYLVDKVLKEKDLVQGEIVKHRHSADLKKMKKKG